jgi:hypothetical protein
MRFACLLPAVLLATGCGVPDVTFTNDAGPRDATRDSPGLDVTAEGEADGQADSEGDANPDATDSGDAGTDAPEYCKGDAGPPSGYRCCIGSPGEVCGGNPCSATNCASCGSSCTWPSRCCASGGSATCVAPDASGC